MVGIFGISVALQAVAVLLAVRLNWVYRHHRSWWLISVALLLMTIRRATAFYNFVVHPPTEPHNLVAELVALNVSVLMVVGLWMLDPLFRSIHDAEQIQKDRHQELSNLITKNAIEMGAQIGERKRAEQESRDRDAIYHSLVETLPLSIIRKNREGQFVFVNSAACEMLQRGREDLLGKKDRELFPPELAQKYQHDDQQVLDLGISLDEVEEFRSPTGELRQVQIMKTPVRDGHDNIVGSQVIFWDVTERRQAIEALARNESIKTAMFEAALDCILTIDEDDKILEFNPAAALTFGYDRAEVLGKTMSELLMPPLARERHRENLSKYLGSGIAGSLMIGRLAVPMLRKDGTQFTAELSMQPIPLDDSTGFTIFLRDITEREQAARKLAKQREQIEHANAELQQEVRVRRRAEEESESRNRDLKTLLYVISHDLREPLRGVRNFANLVKTRYGGNLEDKGRDFLDRVIRGAERLDRQLEDVLILSRAQRLIEPNENVPFQEVVADVLRQLDARIHETDAQIDISENLPVVWADRSWLVQAVLNLVSNALKFTLPGQKPEISIRGFESNQPDQKTCGLVVADRGPGIPKEHAERIFDLFQRAVGRDIEGTGAGLAIVSRIAERHGGQVWCQPQEGGGTEFWLEIGRVKMIGPQTDQED